MDDTRVGGPKIRLLYCMTCKSLEELPDHDGPPDTDVLLQLSVERHPDHVGHLFDVDPSLWGDTAVRKKIIDQIKTGSKGLAEIDADFYDTRSTFHEDALVCYQRHLRPQGACQDWLSDSKILLPDTAAERREAGLEAPSKAPGPKVHLCRFCPVQRYYARRANEARGLK